MKAAELRSEENLVRETMHIACIYGWINRHGWDEQKYGCKIDKSPYPDSGDLIVDQMEASKIVWAMNHQPKPICHWLHYAYGDEHCSDWPWRERQVAYALWLRLGKTRQNYPLAIIATKEFRRRVMEHPPYNDEVLLTQLDVKRWAWHKYLKPKFEDCLDQLQTWDRTGVAHVSITVREIRDGRNT